MTMSDLQGKDVDPCATMVPVERWMKNPEGLLEFWLKSPGGRWCHLL